MVRRTSQDRIEPSGPAGGGPPQGTVEQQLSQFCWDWCWQGGRLGVQGGEKSIIIAGQKY